MVSALMAATAAVALSLVALAPAAAQEPRSCPADELNCNACPSKASGSNILNQLPRFSSSGATTSSNLGAYDLFKCKEHPLSELSPRKGDACPDGAELVDFADLPSEANSPPAGSPVLYGQGVAMYTVGAVLAALAVVAFLPLFCLFRYCCCCAKNCTTCGKKYPSQTCCCRWCCCLFAPCNRCTFKQYQPVDDGEDISPHKLIRYPRGQRLCAFFCMTLFLVFVAVFVGIGMSSGFMALPEAAKAVADSPRGVAHLVRAPMKPIAKFIARAVGLRVVGLLTELKDAVLDAVDLRDLYDKLVCTKSSIDNLPRPDDLLRLVDQINTTIALLPGSVETNAELGKLNDTITTLPVLVSQLILPISQVEAALPKLTDPTISTKLSALNASVEAIKPFPASTLQTFNAIDGALPSVDAVAGPETSMKSRLADLADNTRGNQTFGSDYGQSYRQQLIADLRGLAANLTAMPSVVGFASTLTEFNDTLNGLEANVNGIAGVISDVQTTVDALPDFDAMIGTVEALRGKIEGLTLEGIRGILVRLKDAVVSVPDLGLFTEQFDKIRGMNDALNCTFAVVDILYDVNDTLVELPDGQVGSIIDAVDSINGTLQDALAQIDDLQGNIADFNRTLNDVPDFDAYITDIDSISGDLNSTKDSVNFTSLLLILLDVKSQTNVSFSSLNSTVYDLKATLSDPDTRPSASMVSNLNALNQTQVELPPILTRTADGLDTFTKGFCVNDNTVSCRCTDADACLNGSYVGATTDCGSGDCNMIVAGQVDRCIPTDPSSTTPNSCATDSDCAGACNAVPDLTAVLSQLDAARDNIASKPDSGGIKSQLAEVDSNLGDLPDLDAKIGEANSISSSAEDLQSQQNLTDIRQQLEDIKSSTDDVQDIGDIRDNFDTMSENVDKFDLSDTRQILVDFNGTLDDLPTDTIEDVLDSLNGTIALVYDRLPGYLERIGEANLNRIMFSGKGPEAATVDDVDLAGGLKEFVDVIELIIDEFADTPSVFATLREDVLPRAREYQSEALLRLGPIYYLLVVGDVETVRDPGGDAEVLEDASGALYKDQPAAERVGNTSAGVEDMCLTSACINNTVDAVWTSSIEDAGGPAGISAEMAVLALYLPFLLVALCGCCSCTVGVKCNKWNPAICMVLLALVMLPHLLLMSGVALFVPSVIAADACQSMEDVGRQYIRADRRGVCADMLGGEPLLDGNCFISIQNATASSPAINATVDPVALFEDVFSQCQESSGDATNNPFKRMYRSMGTGLAGYPEVLLGEETIDGLGVALRPALKDPILNSTQRMGGDVTAFFEDLGADLACEEFRGAIYGFKDAFCCDVVGAFSWIAFSFWMLTWSLFCCGVCAGLYGRKRFPNRLWGPEFNQLKEEALAFPPEPPMPTAGGYGMAANVYDSPYPPQGNPRAVIPQGARQIELRRSK